MAMDVQEIVQHVRKRHSSMVRLLRNMARAESPSDAPETQKKMFDLVEEALHPASYRTMRLPGWETGGQLYARPRGPDVGCPMQLLLGHVDTVWSVGTVDEMTVEVRDGRLYGPGVYDMKGGIVQMIYALRTLSALDLDPPITPVVFLNSDEEIGSFESRPRIRRLAREASRTFVLEPSLGPNGKLKTARKGIGRFTVSITAEAESAEGSAIAELSHVVQKLHALNDPERGMSVNVGMIEGGQPSDVAGSQGHAVVDVRMRTQEDARLIEEKVRALKSSTPGVELTIEGGIGRPPMESTPQNRALWKLAQAAGRALGIELEEARAGGGSDGNETSMFSPTLDGLGPVGDGAHAEHEHVELDKMVERTALLVLLLMADPVSEPEASSLSERIRKQA